MKLTTHLQMMGTCAAIIIVSTTWVAAQPEGGRQPGRPGAGQGPGPGGGRGMMAGPGRSGIGLERILMELTPEQRQSLREALMDNRDEARGVEEKIRAARADLLEMALARKFKEDAFRKKAMEVAKLEADRAVRMAKAIAELDPPLSREQVERIKRSLREQSFQPGQERRRGQPDMGRDQNDLPRQEPRPEPGERE